MFADFIIEINYGADNPFLRHSTGLKRPEEHDPAKCQVKSPGIRVPVVGHDNVSDPFLRPDVFAYNGRESNGNMGNVKPTYFARSCRRFSLEGSTPDCAACAYGNTGRRVEGVTKRVWLHVRGASAFQAVSPGRVVSLPPGYVSCIRFRLRTIRHFRALYRKHSTALHR